MPSINIEVDHALEPAAAVAALKNYIESLKSLQGQHVKLEQEDWQGDTLNYSFSTMGMKFAGNMVCDEHKVRVQGKIPLAAIVFKGRIENEIREHLERILVAT